MVSLSVGRLGGGIVALLAVFLLFSTSPIIAILVGVLIIVVLR